LYNDIESQFPARAMRPREERSTFGGGTGWKVIAWISGRRARVVRKSRAIDDEIVAGGDEDDAVCEVNSFMMIVRQIRQECCCGVAIDVCVLFPSMRQVAKLRCVVGKM